MNGSKWKRFIVCASLFAVACSYGAADQKKVSISVQATAMRDVLKFIAEQGDTSIVISPEVSDQMMDITIKDIPLEEALDVVLKPYGCGYSKIGQTVVVDRLDNLSRLNAVEPLISRVFKLKYLDAKGVKSVVESLTSERGTVTVLTSTQVLGWQFAEGGDESDMTKAEREQASKSQDDEASSKTLVVTDTPSVLTRIQSIIDEIDIKPRQVEIRSHFVEFSTDTLRDIGVEWGISKDSGEYQTGKYGTTYGDVDANETPIDTSMQVFNQVAGQSFDAYTGAASGMSLTAARLGNTGMQAILNMAEENEGINVLSAPRILAQENQEAAIIVGKKIPIISTESGSSDSGAISTSIDYYERVGIQLNVVPRICEDERISMVVHPIVSEVDSYVSAKIGTLNGDATTQVPLTEYPVIRTRETETRLISKSGETFAIGGLVSERAVKQEEKVPFLGDIPYLGLLFKREINTSEKIELVILLKATLMDEPDTRSDVFDNIIEKTDHKLIGYWSEKEETMEGAQAKVEEAPAAEKADAVDPEVDALLDELEQSKSQLK